MGRGKKGAPVHGWVVVDKPAGVSSTAVVGKVRWAFDAQKAGHAGTLDPDATGVLAVALGEATKTIPHITDALKAYDFRVVLGAATTTDDASGEVIATSLERPDDARIAAALPAFRGAIRQVPPQFSAVKVAGERAYDLARGGETSDLAPRDLWVEELSLLGRPDADHLDLHMVCGKGGYVRSIARDLGQSLGCLGHVAWLRRLWSGPFRCEDAISLDLLDQLGRSAALRDHLLPLEIALGALPVLDATEAGALRLANGNPGGVGGHDLPNGAEVWVRHNGRALAIGRVLGAEVQPSRVFQGLT